MIPPAILNEFIEIPKKVSMCSPRKIEMANTAPTVQVALKAIGLNSSTFLESVIDKKIGVTLRGFSRAVSASELFMRSCISSFNILILFQYKFFVKRFIGIICMSLLNADVKTDLSWTLVEHFNINMIFTKNCCSLRQNYRVIFNSQSDR